ncbi:putative HrpJ domain-containing protein [Vibrio owensii]|uniref:HrpJ domain-containing protein n=1 Tax=Vibrio owensii TaxID=696485 RepID=A0AAU9Q794_9VIBR|nr:putative HrpJ domain-containing protein [Vibrio owensii]
MNGEPHRAIQLLGNMRAQMKIPSEPATSYRSPAVRHPVSSGDKFNKNGLEEVGITFRGGVKASKKKKKVPKRGGALSVQDVFTNVQKKERATLLTQHYVALGKREGKALTHHVDRLRRHLTNGGTVEEFLKDHEPVMAYIIAAQGLVVGAKHDRPLFTRVTEHLQHKHEQEITSGLNTAFAFAEFSSDPDIKKKIRSIYYDSVIMKSSLHELFEQLLSLSELGQFSFELGIKSVQRGLADDLHSEVSSSNKSALGAMLSHLKQTSTIMGLVNNVTKFRNDLLVAGVTVHPKSVDICKDLIKVTLNPIYSRDMHRIVERSITTKDGGVALFLDGYLKLVKELPTSLWKEGRIRATTLMMMTNMLESFYVDELKLPHDEIRVRII